MQLTTRSRYAIISLTDLASNAKNNRPISLSEISLRQSITVNYLEQIFSKLKKVGLVDSYKGPGGGYFLAKDPKDIKLIQAIDAVEENIKITKCTNKNIGCKTKGIKCVTHDLWNGLETLISNYFQGISIADLCGNEIKNFNLINEDKLNATTGEFTIEGSKCTNEYMRTSGEKDGQTKAPSSPSIYFDHNAASLILPSIRSQIESLPLIPLNPSSVHSAGRIAKSLVENARRQILHSVNAEEDSYNLVFTSSGTESNNMVIKGFSDRLVICSKAEHLSVLTPIMDCNNFRLINIDHNGLLDLDQLEEILKSSSEPCLVSAHLANNETGVIQDIKKICKIAHKYDAIVHSDAIQAYGKIKIDLINTDLDLITVASHKVGGPKAVSALIYRKSIIFSALLKGGGQERGKRAGSENVEAIFGFGQFALHINDSIERLSQLGKIRDFIEAQIQDISPSSIIAKDTPRIPNTSCIVMKDKTSQLQQIAFDLENIAISAGAACSSGKISKSHVLQAMAIDETMASCAIRISLGHNNNLQEAKKFVDSWIKLYTNGLISKRATTTTIEEINADSVAENYWTEEGKHTNSTCTSEDLTKQRTDALSSPSINREAYL